MNDPDIHSPCRVYEFPQDRIVGSRGGHQTALVQLFKPITFEGCHRAVMLIRDVLICACLCFVCRLLLIAADGRLSSDVEQPASDRSPYEQVSDIAKSPQSILHTLRTSHVRALKTRSEESRTADSREAFACESTLSPKSEDSMHKALCYQSESSRIEDLIDIEFRKTARSIPSEFLFEHLVDHIGWIAMQSKTCSPSYALREPEDLERFFKCRLYAAISRLDATLSRA